MAEYIEKKGLLNNFNSCFGIWKGDTTELKMFIKSVINQQPVADVVEVVRCTDCKHFTEHIRMFGNYEYTFFRCDFYDRDTSADHFCSHGEKVGETQ